MNRRVGCCLVAFWLAGFLNAPASLAAADFVILGEGNAFWTNNLNAPVCKELVNLQKGHSFHAVSFTPTGDWVALLEGNGFYTSQVNLPACKKLSELQKGTDITFKCAAFAPTGGWTVLWNQNGNWTQGEIPDEAFKKMQEVVKAGGTLPSIAFGPKGEWVVLFDKTGIWSGNIPDDLSKVFDNAIKKSLTVRCVCFTTGGTWICLTTGGWWTSDANHPASKMIAELDKEHKALHWVAVAPEVGPHDFKKWAAYVHEKCDGKVLGGYAFEVLHKGKVVAEGAEGWAREPSEKDRPNLRWTLDKPMAIASVSKTITAVALLKLWEEKNQKFSLDAPFWPYIKAVCPEASDDAKTVTIRQLLSQKTGFKRIDDCKTPKELEKLLTQPLEHKAGAHYNYDNNNFYAARLVLEQIAKMQYTPYVKSHVLKPMSILDMDTHFQYDAPTLAYGKFGTKRPGYPFDWECDGFAGAAGWYGSVHEMGRFLMGLRDNKVLTAATRDMMYKEKLGWDWDDPGMQKNGGWSWDEGSKPNSRAGTLRSSIFHFPDDVDAVMLMNSDPPTLPENILRDAWVASMQK